MKKPDKCITLYIRFMLFLLFSRARWCSWRTHCGSDSDPCELQAQSWKLPALLRTRMSASVSLKRPEGNPTKHSISTQQHKHTISVQSKQVLTGPRVLVATPTTSVKPQAVPATLSAKIVKQQAIANGFQQGRLTSRCCASWEAAPWSQAASSMAVETHRLSAR